MENFKIKLAKLTVSVRCIYPETKEFCKDYISDGAPDIEVNITPEHNLAEQNLSLEKVSLKLAEQLAVYRQIAERLPYFKSAVFHGAVISYNGRAIMFTAPSGTGKTTHIRLWKKFLGSKVGIVNGDKPIISFDGGSPSAFGTPWSGKEGWQKNVSAPLSAICIIRQAKENKIQRLEVGEALGSIMKQIYLPKNSEALNLTLDLLDKLLLSTPIYLLDCDISEQAVKTSFEALTNEEYKK